jgi:hypothetical protein
MYMYGQLLQMVHLSIATHLAVRKSMGYEDVATEIHYQTSIRVLLFLIIEYAYSCKVVYVSTPHWEYLDYTRKYQHYGFYDEYDPQHITAKGTRVRGVPLVSFAPLGYCDWWTRLSAWSIVLKSFPAFTIKYSCP